MSCMQKRPTCRSVPGRARGSWRCSNRAAADGHGQRVAGRMKPRDAASRGQLAPAQAPHRRQPLRSPLDLLRRRKKLLAVSVLVTAALALYSGYLHAVWPKCSPPAVAEDAGLKQMQHEAVRISGLQALGRRGRRTASEHVVRKVLSWCCRRFARSPAHVVPSE